MGAKDYDFSDAYPEYRGSNRLDYRSKSEDKSRKRRKAPRSRAVAASSHAGVHQRRNKHMNW